MARLQIGNTKEPFTIHEELICSQSPYFRERLQKGRKPIEGECPICHENMNPTRTDITFCRVSCGANIHSDCLEKWKMQSSFLMRSTTCPMCRRMWQSERSEQTHTFLALSAKPFHCYYEWSYSRHIPLSTLKSSPNNIEAGWDMDALINAYSLGTRIQDNTFSKAVLQALCEVCQDEDRYPGGGSIALAYASTTDGSPLRKLLVDIYVLRAETSWFERDDEWRGYPPKFLTDLAMAFFNQRRVSNDCEEELEQLKDKYCINNGQRPE
ncbi:hypothetical protein IQ06DRAFT_232464 [Phaeosphaeriaceae sp. SRC1lsM3a]|nr:hypothetical protein IQ06DRAFT_232464 [Stagonospora sp. SRC1lsM3a]